MSDPSCASGCSCDCHRVIINCGSGGQPEKQKPPTPTPTAEKICDTALVTIHSVKVTNDGGKSGPSRWMLTFNVNGQVRRLVQNNVKVTDPPYALGFSFEVPLYAPPSRIILRVEGEMEGGIWETDDPLPSLVKNYGQPQNWGIGLHTESASDRQFAYTVDYEIQCAYFATTAVVNIEELVSRVRNLGQQFSSQTTQEQFQRFQRLSDSEILSVYLNKFARKGWTVKHISQSLIVFEGYGVQRSPMDYFRKENGENT